MAPGGRCIFDLPEVCCFAGECFALCGDGGDARQSNAGIGKHTMQLRVLFGQRMSVREP